MEELLAKGLWQAGGLAVPAEPLSGSPALAYRAWWTWDHSTNWELSQIGHQEIGVFNPYGKPPGGFLADYKRAVDFARQVRRIRKDNGLGRPEAESVVRLIIDSVVDREVQDGEDPVVELVGRRQPSA